MLNKDTLKYTPFLFEFKYIQISSSTTAIMPICTHLPVRPGSQPGRLCRAGTPPGAGSSSHGWVSSRFVPLWKVELRLVRFQHPSPELLLSAATHPEPDFIGVLTVQGKKQNKNTALHRPNPWERTVVSKHYNNSNKNDILIFRCRVKLFPAQKCASGEYCDGSYSLQENDVLRSIK